MLLESDNDSGDNSVACTIKEWQKVAYQGDNISTFIYFCCSCSRFFNICSRLLLILKNISRIEKLIQNILNKFQMSLSQRLLECHKSYFFTEYVVYIFHFNHCYITRCVAQLNFLQNAQIMACRFCSAMTVNSSARLYFYQY